MKLEPPKNANYSATVISVGALVELPGLDNLVGVPVLGCTALTQRDVSVGDLRIAFTAETALSEEYARENNLFRDESLNSDPKEVGYLEKNARIRAIRLRGNTSSALLMPLSSLAYTGINPDELREGDTFDTLNGHPICRKYEVQKQHRQDPAKSKIDKAFKRVDKKIFPEHLSTDSYWRNKHLLQDSREVVITQKLHGTSIRVGRVPVLRNKSWTERVFVNGVFRIKTPEYEYRVVCGSRKVIKSVVGDGRGMGRGAA